MDSKPFEPIAGSLAQLALEHAQTAATQELKELYLKLSERWRSLAQSELSPLAGEG